MLEVSPKKILYSRRYLIPLNAEICSKNEMRRQDPVKRLAAGLKGKG